MAEYLGKRPSKGILKTSSSFEKPDAPKKSSKSQEILSRELQIVQQEKPPGVPIANRKHKETKWDEMNIIATLHPPDKDYGHMKIEEPKTPYIYAEGYESGEEVDAVNAQILAEKLRDGAANASKRFDSSESEDESDEETCEQKAQRKVFESKRKAHYNEYYAVKLARKLMDEDEEAELMEGTESVPMDSETDKDIGKDYELNYSLGLPACSGLQTMKSSSDSVSNPTDE